MTLKKKISRQIKALPKYKINQEAFDTKNLAYSRAFGRAGEIQAAEQAIEASGSEAINQSKDITSSTSGLLATLAAIEGGKQGAFQRLAQDESSIKTQAMQGVYQANQMMIDEKDKAWYQNVYAPWEMKLKQLQAKKANRNAFWTTMARAFIDPGNLSGAFGKPLGDSGQLEPTSQDSGGYASVGGIGQIFGGGGGRTGKSSGGDDQVGGGVGQIAGAVAGILSDASAKANIIPTDSGLKDVLQINVVEYNYKNNNSRHIGVIAQELQKVIPSAVLPGNLLRVDYNEVVPVLIKAVQEQQKQIDLMQKKLTEHGLS